MKYLFLLAASVIVFTAGPVRATEAGRQQMTLDEAVAIALRQNPSILEARQEIERTEGLVVEVRAQALPRAAIFGAYDQSSGEIARTPQNQSWRVAIEGEQILYAGGQVLAALATADLSRQSSFFFLRETVDRVIESVRRQFYLVLLSEALIAVQEGTIELLERELEDERNRFEAGTVPRFNVLRAEVELSNAKPLLIRARNAYRISRLELAKLLGVDSESGPDGDFPFRAVGDFIHEPVGTSLQDALQAALERRALLQIQRLAILQAAEQIKIAAAGYKPQLSAVGGYEFRSDTFASSLDEVLQGWFVGVRGRWNVFDGLETAGQVQQARARLEQSKIRYDDSVQQVKLEVQAAFSRILEADELIQSQQLNVGQAEEALRLARERLAAGAGTQLELLDARVSLTRAQVTELESRFDYVSALAELDRATGVATGYSEIFPDPVVQYVDSDAGKAPPAAGFRRPRSAR